MSALRFPGPLFLVELRRQTRRRREYVIRALIGLVILGAILVRSLVWILADGQTFSSGLGRLAGLTCMTISGCLGFAVVLITPASVAGAIAETRSRRTIDLLIGSPLGSLEIVLGIFLARMVSLIGYLAIGLPVQIALGVIGGVSAWAGVSMFASTIAVVFLVGSLSLISSTLCRKPQNAVVLAYALAMAWFAIPPVIEGPLRGILPGLSERTEPITHLLTLSNPLSIRGASSGSHGLLIEILSSLGCILTLFSAFVFRWAAKRERPFERRTPRFRFPNPMTDTPMRWKEHSTSQASSILFRLVQPLSWGLVGLLAFLAIRHLASLEPVFDPVQEFSLRQRDFSQFLRIANVGLVFLGLVMATASGATSITREREIETWSSLLATPLDGPEILSGKRSGARRRNRPVWVALLGLWLCGILGGVLSPGLCLIAMAVTWSGFRFAAALGVWISLEMSTSTRALIVSLLTLALLQGGYLLCCVPMPHLSTFVVFGCTPLLNDLSLAASSVSGKNALYPTGRMVQELPISAFLSVVAYSLATLGVCLVSEIDFDRVADRPYRPSANRDDLTR